MLSRFCAETEACVRVVSRGGGGYLRFVRAFRKISVVDMGMSRPSVDLIEGHPVVNQARGYGRRDLVISVCLSSCHVCCIATLVHTLGNPAACLARPQAVISPV